MKLNSLSSGSTAELTRSRISRWLSGSNIWVVFCINIDRLSGRDCDGVVEAVAPGSGVEKRLAVEESSAYCGHDAEVSQLLIAELHEMNCSCSALAAEKLDYYVL